ncbi:MAG: preprotein translocase subunit YajC [Planctomycetota bacterium]
MNQIIELGLLAANGSGGDGSGGEGGLPPGALWIGIILMFVIFYAVMLSPQRKEKKKRQEMLAAIKKNDRAMTIGGIIGSVVSVSDNEIVIKIDESANVKMTVSRSAIQKVITEEESAVVTK